MSVYSIRILIGGSLGCIITLVSIFFVIIPSRKKGSLLSDACFPCKFSRSFGWFFFASFSFSFSIIYMTQVLSIQIFFLLQIKLSWHKVHNI
jgi:hypothetical protein